MTFDDNQLAEVGAAEMAGLPWRVTEIDDPRALRNYPLFGITAEVGADRVWMAAAAGHLTIDPDLAAAFAMREAAEGEMRRRLPR
jgi:hypothetical protein